VFIFFNGQEHYFPTKRNPHESNKMEHHLFTFGETNWCLKAERSHTFMPFNLFFSLIHVPTFSNPVT
jgi:hypothetical protein